MELYLPPADSTTSVFLNTHASSGHVKQHYSAAVEGHRLGGGCTTKLHPCCSGACQTRTTVASAPPPRYYAALTSPLPYGHLLAASTALSSPPRHTGSARLSVDQEASSSSVASLLFFSTGFFWGEVGRVTRDEVVVVGRECVAVVCLCGARMERRVFAGRGGLCTTAPGSATSKSARLPVRAGILCSSNVVSAHASIRFYTIEHKP